MKTTVIETKKYLKTRFFVKLNKEVMKLKDKLKRIINYEK